MSTHFWQASSFLPCLSIPWCPKAIEGIPGPRCSRRFPLMLTKICGLSLKMMRQDEDLKICTEKIWRFAPRSLLRKRFFFASINNSIGDPLHIQTGAEASPAPSRLSRPLSSLRSLPKCFWSTRSDRSASGLANSSCNRNSLPRNQERKKGWEKAYDTSCLQSARGASSTTRGAAIRLRHPKTHPKFSSPRGRKPVQIGGFWREILK